jgi:hypothetical protein
MVGKCGGGSAYALGQGELVRRICENKLVGMVLVGTYRGRPLYGLGELNRRIYESKTDKC